MPMLSAVFGVWALTSTTLAGSAPGPGSAAGSSLRGATEPTSQAPGARPAQEGVNNSTEASQAERNQISAEDVEAKIAAGAATRFLAYGFNPSPSKPTFLTSTKPLFKLDERAVDVVKYLNLKSKTRTSESTEKATKEITAEMGIGGSYGPAFSASVFASTSSMSTSNFHKVRADTFIRAEKFVATFHGAFPHRTLLPDVKKFLLEQEPARIVAVFGQFYAAKLTLGGFFRGSVVKEVSSHDDARKLSASFKVNAGALTAFSVKGKAGVDRQHSKLFQNAVKEYAVQGGDITTWLAVTNNNADAIKAKWAGTVTSDTLAALGFEGLQPIWTLLDHDDMNRAKAQEVKRYLMGRWAADVQRVRYAEGQARYKTTTTTTTTTVAPAFSGWYSLENVNSGKYMVPYCWFSCGSGTLVTQHSHNPIMARNERWRLVPVGRGVHTLRSARGGYLTIRGGDYNSGGKAELRSNWRSYAAQWIVSCPKGTNNRPCTLRNRRSRRFLSVDRASKDNDAQVVQWSKWWAGPQAQWKFARV